MGLGSELQLVLDELRTVGEYRTCAVCTAEGLLLAASGDELDPEALAGVVSMFDAVAGLASDHLGCTEMDEATFLDRNLGRIIVRPLEGTSTRFFLITMAPKNRTWRRNTNRTVNRIRPLLQRAFTEIFDE